MKMQSAVFRWSSVAFCYFVLPLSCTLKPEEKRGTFSAESSDVRLVGKGSPCAGQLRLKHEFEWRPLSSRHSWSLKEVAVVCRQLDCGSAVSTRKIERWSGLQDVWHFYSDCEGSEGALMDCGTVKKSFSSHTTEVMCSDILPRPNITVYTEVGTTSRAWTQTQEHVVSKSHSFTIGCSVERQYREGVFNLIFTGLHQTRTWTQTSWNYSASFMFTAANNTHEGNYSCVYHSFVFGFNVSSKSESLSLTVKEDSDVILDRLLRDGDDYSVCEGKLLINSSGEIRAVSAESSVWDLKHAGVVCRQLRCGSAVSTKAIKQPSKTPVWRFFSDCDGSESALMGCGAVNPWVSSSVVEVTCAGGSRRN